MRYLKLHDWSEWMDDLEPKVNNVYIHDMPMIANHDVACPICLDKSAVFTRHMTPGHYAQSFQPCHGCQQQGWTTVQIKPFFRRWLIKLGIIHD